jgi:hypothetical protein
MKTHKILSLAALLLFLISACKKEEQVVSPPLPGNEFLTTIQLRLISSDQQDTVTAVWRDLTPEDSNPADTANAVLTLKANTTYAAVIELLDETKTPAEDITGEIQERANYHRIFYFPSSALGNNLVWTVNDLDTNTPPLALGITASVSTLDVASGSLNVILRHQPNVKDGTFAPGSTDIDVHFRVNITL